MNFSWCYYHLESKSVFDQIVKNRGISSTFFQTSLEDIPDFSLMKDLEKAAIRIIKAIENKEKIMIYGHDDLDGITSTYILYDFLEKVGSQNHFYYIPNRLIDNHGMQNRFISKMKHEDFDLLITVDGGISEFDAVKQLNTCDVIITDHHIIQEKIPDAFAIVNPKQKDCKFPFDAMAGVGVTYYLILQLASILKMEIDKNYLFWVAAGTVADRVPLVGVNRIFVKEVINNWFTFDDQNLKNLEAYFSSALKIQNRIKIIRFINRLLSNGRLPDGKNLSLEFLLAIESEVKDQIISELFSGLYAHEDQLKKIKKHINEIKLPDFAKSYIHIDKEDIIPSEFLGFCANIITKKYKIPTIMIKEKNRILSAEARCPEGLDLVEMFTFCQDALIQFGGHKKAAGFTAEKENLELFKEKFTEYINKNNIEQNQNLKIDAHIKTDELHKLDEYLDFDHNILQPFGQGNPDPVFLIKNFQPKRDTHKLKIRGVQKKLNWEDSYNIVIKIRNNFMEIIDYRPVNYVL